MISNITLTYINLRLCKIFDTGDINDGWFGRIHLLMFGDLLQLPPVNEESPFMSLKKNQIDKYTHSLGALNIWANLFSYDELIENMRQKNDSIYASVLERVRINAVTPTDIKLINKRVIKFNINNNNKHNAVIVELYNLISSLPESALVLLPTRNHCKVLNKGVLELLATEIINLEEQDSVDAKPTSKCKAMKKLALLNSDSSRIAGLEKNIKTKLNCKIMLIRNIDVTLGLVNGTIGTVKQVIHDGFSGIAIKIKITVLLYLFII